MVQGLKSLVSKLHPQLPLSPKESQRLLTALTSSFRKQLDEAHPQQAQDEDVRPKLDRESFRRPGFHGLHTSSASFADRHLASVLTNPLLAKNAGDENPDAAYEKAKSELEENPDKDPILVLEEYQDKGTATIALADLCLRTFQASLLDLLKDERQQKVAEAKAGVRTLRWLSGSGLYASESFAQDRKFMGALVSMLIEEGEEQLLWDWLRIDLRHRPYSRIGHKQVSGGPSALFRWKDFMLRLMIMRRSDNNNPASMNDILDTYFKALDIHLELKPDLPNNFLPLGSSVGAINDWIFKKRHTQKAWDVERYNRYMKSLPLTETDSNSIWVEFKIALLQLTHPKRPSGYPLYNCLKSSALAASGSHEAKVWMIFTKDHGYRDAKSKIRGKHYNVLVDTARLLRIQGYREEAEWLIREICKLFPEFERWLDEDLAHPKPAAKSLGPHHPLGPHMRDITPSLAIT